MTQSENSIGDMLRETATRVFQDHCQPEVLRRAEHGEWAAEAWHALEEAGLHRALVPESAGGFGVDVVDALSLVRTAAEFALPLPLAETMLASWLLAQSGLPIPDGPLTVAPVARGVIAPVARGEITPVARGEIAPVAQGETLALAQAGGSWRLDGAASRVPWGRDAVAIAVLVPADSGSRVALARKGDWTIDQIGENVAREPRDTLRFATALAEVGRTALDPAAFRAAGAALRTQQIAGALTRLTAMTTQYAQDRIQFGRPIGKFQAVQQNLAVLAGQTAAAVAAADLAAESVADGIRLLPIAAAKARAGEAAGTGAAIAHQVHGAIGFTFEHSLHFLTRRLWSWRDEFGNEAAWNLLVGRHMAQAGADRLWTEITAA
jgi:acyl-CoA dehydrogenase